MVSPEFPSVVENLAVTVGYLSVFHIKSSAHNVRMSYGKSPAFFVPGCTPEKHEEAFLAMAELLPNQLLAPEPGKRIYSISFRHDGDVWFATVGQSMRGRRQVWQGRKKTETTVSIEDSAIVAAIYPTCEDNLFWVYHDGGQDSRRRSKWALPFMAGEASVIEYFPK